MTRRWRIQQPRIGGPSTVKGSGGNGSCHEGTFEFSGQEGDFRAVRVVREMIRVRSRKLVPKRGGGEQTREGGGVIGREGGCKPAACGDGVGASPTASLAPAARP